MTKCKECGDKFSSRSGLSKHLKAHNITIKEYLIKHKYNGNHPTCKCGCGKKTNYNHNKGDFCDYLRGHYARVNDDVSQAISGRTPWNKGKERSEETKRKISETKQENMPTGEDHHWYIDGRSENYDYSDYEGFTKSLRQRIRKRDEFTCLLCDKKGIEVHHIDHDKKNSNDQNLVTLCSSCHQFYHHTEDNKQKDLQKLFIRYAKNSDV
jgi:hypothetical protein